MPIMSSLSFGHCATRRGGGKMPNPEQQVEPGRRR
jgi:hypothetical protein